MTVELQQDTDLIELARNNRVESERKPQIVKLGAEIAKGLNDFFEREKGRRLITQESISRGFQLPIAEEEPIEVTIYTGKDIKWDKSIFGARCFGIYVEHTHQRLELAVDIEESLLEVRFVKDASVTGQRSERFPTLAEFEAYVSILDRLGIQLNDRKPTISAPAG